MYLITLPLLIMEMQDMRTNLILLRMEMRDMKIIEDMIIEIEKDSLYLELILWLVFLNIFVHYFVVIQWNY